MENLQLWILIVVTGVSLIGTIFTVWMRIQNPDIKANDRLNVIERVCPINHSRINEIFANTEKSIADINETFRFFQRNDFKHIDDNTKEINVRMARMEGQMETIIMLTKDLLQKNNS